MKTRISTSRLIAITLLCSAAVTLLFAASGIGTRESEESEENESRPDQPDEAQRFRQLQLQDESKKIPADGLQKAREQMAVMRAAQQRRAATAGKAGGLEVAGINPGSWTWLGPGNVGGRIRTIVIDPADANKVWVGSASGGIWKSGDAGAHWGPVDDFMANLAVSTMVIDPTNSSVMYAGTGEAFPTTREFDFDGNYGVRGGGVFKSTDAGVTWNLVASTNPAIDPPPPGCGLGAAPCPSFWFYVKRLAISPDGSTILAATNSGIARSTNGGTTWIAKTNANVLDIDFLPGDSMQAVAGELGSARFSTDGGESWSAAMFDGSTTITLGSTGNGRVELASSSGVVYAAVNNNHGDLYRSTDGGRAFTRVNTGSNFFLGAGNQGGYDNIIWVNPQDPSFVIVGGIDLWRSTDSGATFAKASDWRYAPIVSAHADQHMIVASPEFNNTSNKTVYFSNDGGIYRTDDISFVSFFTGLLTLDNLNHNLGITQFWGAAANSAGVIVGGTQDNGTLMYYYDPQGWFAMAGGDGGYAAADPVDNNYFYGEYTNLGIQRSTDGGLTSQFIYCDPPPSPGNTGPCTGTGIMDAFNGANFVAPFILDPGDPNRMLAGGLSLWRSNNVKAGLFDFPTWTAIKPPAAPRSTPPPPPAPTPTPGPLPTPPISAIAVSPNNSDFIVVGHNDGQIYLTFTGTNAVPLWFLINKPNTPVRFVTRLVVDETRSPNWIYATFGGFSEDNIYRTTDLGATWTDVSGVAGSDTDLPSVPVRGLAINPVHPDYLYAGTEVGIFASEDGGTTWGLTQDGPANVSVDELFWLHGDLVAATHGRGLYKTSEPAFIFGGGAPGPGGVCIAPPSDECPCFGIWECPCSWNIGRVPESTDDVGISCMTVTSQFSGARNVRVNNRLTITDGVQLFVTGSLSNYGTITSSTIPSNVSTSIYVGHSFSNFSGLVTLGAISVQEDVSNGGIIALSATFSCGGDLSMAGSSTLTAPNVIVGGNLTNSGTMNGTALSVLATPQHTFSGSGIWGFNSLSIPSGATVSLGSNVTFDITSVFNNGILDFGTSSLNFTGNYFASGGPALGIGTLNFAPTSGSAQFLGNGPSVVIASGNIQYQSGGTIGALTIGNGATFDMNTPGTLTANGDVTVNGTLGSSGFTPSLIFNGTTFTNNGAVGPIYFLTFNNSETPKSQVITGLGSWAPVNVRIGDFSLSLTTVTLENDANFASNSFITGLGSLLDIGTHTLTLSGQSNAVYGKISGSGLVKVQPSGGTPTLGGTTASTVLTVDPSLEIVSGTVRGTGTIVGGSFTIDSGATLSLFDFLAIAANGDLTNNGTINSFSGNPTLSFKGGTFTNNGSVTGNVFVNIGSFAVPHLMQNLAGTGSWAGSQRLTIDSATLLNDFTYNGGNLSVEGILNTGAFTLSLPCDVTWSGAGDVVGNIRRTNLAACPGGTIAYGNPFTSIAFSSGTPPNELNVNLALSAPAGFGNAVRRTYTITPTGGSNYTATLRLHYLDSELNGNNEATLQLFRNDGANWSAQGATNRNTTNNWVEYSGVTQFSPWTLSSLVPATPSPTPTATATGTPTPSPTPATTPTPTPTPLPSGVVYGISNGFGVPAANQIYQINLATAAVSSNVQVTLPGFTILRSLALAARPSDGTLFAVVQTATSFSSRRLVTVNPATGLCTDVGLLGGQAMASLAFRSNGVLYAASGMNGPNPKTLFTVNTTTGVPTIAFPLPNGADGDVIAFHGNGLLYHSSGNATAIFESVNVDTQVVTPIGSATSESYCMGYRSDTVQLYGSDLTNNLYTVNIATGARSVIGPFTPTLSGFNRGLAFIPIPTATPTPSPTPTPATISISGAVSYCSNPVPGPVANVTITLTGSGSGSTLTDASGTYAFSSLPAGGGYTVTPSKSGLAPGTAGINTVDVIAAQRQFLNLGTPLSGCRLTAADVNGVGGVNTVDVVAIQRFFLGLATGIANTGKYQFNPVNRTYTSVVSNQTGQNYDALIFGDVASSFVH